MGLNLRRWAIRQLFHNDGSSCEEDWIMSDGYSHPDVNRAELFYSDKDAAIARMRHNLSPDHWGIVEVDLMDVRSI